MSEWKEVKLGMLGNIITGKTPRTAIEDNYGGTIPFLTPSDDMSVKHVVFTKKTLSEKGLAEVKNCLLPCGSVCVSCIGSDLGKVVITTGDTITNQQINSIIVNENNNNDFVYYLLTIVGKELNRISKTSTAVPIINKTTFSSYKIKIPDLFTQQVIAGILSSLDAKIETNNKLNEKLEEMAQAIFKSWFVDFEPFKDKPFHETELGMIPEGWEVGSILDIAELFDSQRKPLSSMEREYMKGKYPYYGATSIMDYIDKYIFDGTYLLMGEDGSVVKENGNPYLQYVWGKFWPNNHAHVMQGRNGYSTEMLYCLLSITDVSSIVTGAVQMKISQRSMSRLLTVIPSKSVCNKFNTIIRPIFDIIKRTREENDRLASLRDTLLPRLMSGELIV